MVTLIEALLRQKVIKLKDFIAVGGREKACNQAGKMAIEGKHHVVQDGDIDHFRCNA